MLKKSPISILLHETRSHRFNFSATVSQSFYQSWSWHQRAHIVCCHAVHQPLVHFFFVSWQIPCLFILFRSESVAIRNCSVNTELIRRKFNFWTIIQNSSSQRWNVLKYYFSLVSEFHDLEHWHLWTLDEWVSLKIRSIFAADSIPSSFWSAISCSRPFPFSSRTDSSPMTCLKSLCLLFYLFWIPSTRVIIICFGPFDVVEHGHEDDPVKELSWCLIFTLRVILDLL